LRCLASPDGKCRSRDAVFPGPPRRGDRAGLLSDRTDDTDVGGAPPRTTVPFGVFTGVLVTIGGLGGILPFGPATRTVA
jgi:hypothetical protein